MIGNIFGAICLISTVSALIFGNFTALGTAILDGTGAAVTLTLTLCGMMCLWNGLLNVFREAGFIKKLAKILSPVLRLFFPDAYRTGHGTEEITACISANLLGIGNAATPLALAAMKELNRDADPEGTATPDMITLTLLNSAPLTLLPSSLIALRRAAGSENPFSVVVPVWIASAASALFALILSRLFAGTVQKKPPSSPHSPLQPNIFRKAGTFRARGTSIEMEAAVPVPSCPVRRKSHGCH